MFTRCDAYPLSLSAVVNSNKCGLQRPTTLCDGIDFLHHFDEYLSLFYS